MRLQTEMSRSLLRTLSFLFLLIAILSLTSCGGASPAPINGATPLGVVSVAVVPPSMSIPTGTTQAFSATVNNSNVSGVQWLVNGFPGGGGNIGTIDSSGNYTAPQFIPNPPTVTITAIADADNTKSGSAQVTITGAQVPAHVIMSPSPTAYLQVGTSMPLSAAVTGPADTGIIWEVVHNGTVVTDGNASFGMITPATNGNATYKAPAAVPAGGTVTIRAASHAQPNVFASCQVVISVGPPAFETVIISPVAANVQVQMSNQFNVTIIGTTNQSALWELNGIPGGDSVIGNIRQNGLYIAPQFVPALPTPNTVTIKAISETQPSATSTGVVTIVPGPPDSTSIAINPTSVASLATSSEVDFSASVTFASSQAVSWYVNGVLDGNATYGTIAVNKESPLQATYFAPAAVPALNPVIVSVVPTAAPTLSASAVVTIVPPTVTVTITPSKPCIEINATQDFQAEVTGLSNQNVNWYVNGILSGNATAGTILNTGSNNTTYTAPAKVPSPVAAVAIKATSVIDSSASGTATATIVAHPMINLTPPTQNVEETLGQVITATPCAGLDNLSLLWYANGEQGGDPTVNGTINPIPDTNPPQADYVAPPTIPSPPTVAITAVDQNSGTQSTTAIMTIVPLVVAVSITVQPTSATLMPSQQQEFTADVKNTSDQIVNWTLSGPPGGCNPTICGTITPDPNNTLVAIYMAPPAIPADPNITVIATAQAAPNPQATAAVTIAILPASISIVPANPTVQAGSTNTTTFVATVENVDPTTTEVSWTLGCNSQAPLIAGTLAENCRSYIGDGAGPGCLSDGNGNDICYAGSFSDLATVNLSYIPPKILGSNFEENACASSPGTDGLVPLTANFTAPNCGTSGICQATICITVTPP